MDVSTQGYRILELAALSGELSTDIPDRLGISPSYAEKLITRLKEDRLLKTHYKDRLRGYRLTNAGKRLLLANNPDRFSFFLTGSTETNQPRSDLPRRLRLQQASNTYAFLHNAGVTFFRDSKPLLFSPDSDDWEGALPFPVFYHSRELKELGAETTKINNSRTIGVLLAEDCILAFFYTGDSLMKWEYKTEIRVKALLSYHASRGVLSPWYHPDTPIYTVLLGRNMDTSLKHLNSTGGYRKSYFYLDTSFDRFYFLPDSHAGKVLLKLLCQKPLYEQLTQLLLSDLAPPSPDLGLYHDAIQDGEPVLLAFDFDMMKISRYLTVLSMHRIHGHLICFDFQRDALQEYFGEAAAITTIDLEKFERRFFP